VTPHASRDGTPDANLKGFALYQLCVDGELRASLRGLSPAEMRERAIDYTLMAAAANSGRARATFLRVAALLRELAREVASVPLEGDGASPATPAFPALAKPPGAA